jgi:hypothetical protein
MFDWHRALRRYPPAEIAAMVLSHRQGTPPDGCCQRDAGRSPGSRVSTSGPVFPCLLRRSDPPYSAQEKGGRASGSPLTVAGAAADLPPEPRFRPRRTAFPFHPLARDRRRISISLCGLSLQDLTLGLSTKNPTLMAVPVESALS